MTSGVQQAAGDGTPTQPIRNQVRQPLTPKQHRFVIEYLVDLNATQAALRAGYSARTAPQQGSRLLKNVGRDAPACAVSSDPVDLSVATRYRVRI